MPYQESGMGIGAWFLITSILIGIGVAALFYWNILTLDIVYNWFGLQKTPGRIAQEQVKPTSISNMVETATCPKQNLPTSSQDDKPISITQFGFDVVNACCLSEFRGFRCNKEDLSSIYICQTSQVNGQVIYVREDNNYLQPELGISLIAQLHKSKWSC